jgi:hypothetical protein
MLAAIIDKALPQCRADTTVVIGHRLTIFGAGYLVEQTPLWRPRLIAESAKLRSTWLSSALPRMPRCIGLAALFSSPSVRVDTTCLSCKWLNRN